jgi:hypothetical protein
MSSGTKRGKLGAWLTRALSARLLLCFVLLAFCAAPAPGDVGGCNQTAQELDPDAFFASKQSIDCERCLGCSLSSSSCDSACGAVPIKGEFAEGCVPLVHDGEVCLRALQTASCKQYATFVRDQAPAVPTECDFCPRSAQ